MAEGKKRVFTREAAVTAVIEMIDRIQAVNNGNADHPYLNRIQDVILFGSLVNNPEAEYVHDADVAVITDDDRNKMLEFRKLHPELSVRGDVISNFFTEHVLMMRYIKGKKYLLSILSNVEEGNGVRDFATTDKHIWLFKDYSLCEDAIDQLKELIKP